MVQGAFFPLSKTAESTVLEATTGVVQMKLLDTKNTGKFKSQHWIPEQSTWTCPNFQDGPLLTLEAEKCILRFHFVRRFAISTVVLLSIYVGQCFLRSYVICLAAKLQNLSVVTLLLLSYHCW